MDTTTIKNGAAYIRVSTDKQEELSPDAQKRMILEYAKKNNILILSEDIYIENGKLVFGSQDNPNYNEEKTYGLYLIIACYITACARVHLMQGCYDIITAGGIVYYMDTDSLYFTCDSLKVRKNGLTNN